jgi:hypothetical protein
MSREDHAPSPAETGDATADFAHEAEQSQPGFFREFWDFLRFNKKWWLTPIILVLLLFGLLVILGGTGVAPFVYTLF